MNFLITGADGFVGKKLSLALSLQGHAVRSAVRSSDSSLENATVVGSIDNKTDWSSALQGMEVIIHLAARVHVMNDNADDPLAEFRRVNVAGTERLARSAAQCRVRRLVYVSSVKVNGEATYGDCVFAESGKVLPKDPYGISKWEAEQVLRRVAQETGLEVVVVRPPLVYGSEVRGNFAQMLAVLSKGIPLPLAAVHNLRSLIYAGNLVDALIVCATHSNAAGQTYLVSDGDDVSTPRLLELLGEGIGCSARLFSFPLVLLRLAGRIIGKSNQIERLLESLRVDSGKIRRELNWTPPYTLQQGLKETAEWYRNTYL